MRLFLLPCPLLLLLACGSKPTDTSDTPTDTSPPAPDADEDGYGDAASGGDDCDDTDAYTHPGADDVPYDGRDQDCDGADLTDVDGDGHTGIPAGGDDCNDGNPTIYPGADEICYDNLDNDCDGRGGSDDTAAQDDCDGDGTTRVDDCDDEDPAIHPGADDAWYDGIDSDCDSRSDYDQDEDGVDAPSGGGLDCDDTNPAVQPAADEVWNGYDDDCDGVTDRLNTGAAASNWYGEYASDNAWLGYDYAITDDVDADGVQDVAIGAPLTGQTEASYTGAVYLMSTAGGTAAPSSAALASISGNSGDYLGIALATLDDRSLVVAGLTMAWIYPAGSVTGALQVNDAPTSVSANSIGYADAWLDGLVTVGDPYDVAGASVMVWSGAQLTAGGDLSASDAWFALTDTAAGRGAGFPGDVDGDGLPEVVYAEAGFASSVKVGVVSGADIALGGVWSGADVPGLTGAPAADAVEPVRASGGVDFDGDGYGDVAIGAADADGAATGGGLVYLLDGEAALDGGALATLAYATVYGPMEAGRLTPARNHADIDGDGTPDLVLAMPGAGTGEVRSEIRFVPHDTVAAGGAITPDAASPVFIASTTDDQFGYTVRVADVDADGDTDLFASALNSYGSLAWFRQD